MSRMADFQGSSSRTPARTFEDHVGPYRLLIRLGIGLMQGLLLYTTHRLTEFSNFDASWKVALLLVALYAPPVWLAAVGQVSTLAAVIWSFVPTALLGGIGLATGLLAEQDNILLVILICLPAALFCAHHLVIPALARSRPFAPYVDYYETAWKAGIQLVLALMFLGAFWLILITGAALFEAIGIPALRRLISEEWFILTICPLVFAIGVELSDVREGLTQGIRTVALGLLSWLLPVIVFLAAAFLVTLVVAGMTGIHTSLSPAGFMLGLSAGMIILINTVYQDGMGHLSGSRVLRMVMRIGCVLLWPMMALALWAVAVRVGQHGLTVSRVVALTASIIGMIYATGYTLAQLPRRSGKGWLPLLERSNVFTAVVTAITLIAFSTPWFNPQQMSLNSQLARVAAGTLEADRIPYIWLGRHGGPRARAALEQLAGSENPEIARRARQALENPHSSPPAAGTIRFLPEGTVPPEGFDAAELCQFGDCPARLFDMDTDGQDEILVQWAGNITVFKRDSEGHWNSIGTLNPRPSCQTDYISPQIFSDGEIKSLPPQTRPSVDIGGKPVDFVPLPDCDQP